MTDVTTDNGQAPVELSAADEQVLRELTDRARAGGLRLTGEGGLLGKLTKMVVEGALEGDSMTTWVTAGTTRRAGMAAIPATAIGPRP